MATVTITVPKVDLLDVCRLARFYRVSPQEVLDEWDDEVRVAAYGYMVNYMSSRGQERDGYI